MTDDCIARMKALIPRIREADTAYYKHDKPIMTDREYDALYDELLALEKSTGIVLSGSPTPNRGGRGTGGANRGCAYPTHAFCGKDQIHR